MNYHLWKLLSSPTHTALLALAVAALAGAVYFLVAKLRRKGSWLVYLIGGVVSIYVGALAWWHFMTLVDCGKPVPRLNAEMRQLKTDLQARIGTDGATVEVCDSKLILHVSVYGLSDKGRQDLLANEVRKQRQGSLKTTVISFYRTGPDPGYEPLREENF